MAASAGPEIERLISLLAKLPGLGPRSARRAALALLKRREQLLVPLAARVCEAFPNTFGASDKRRTTGNPVRTELFMDIARQPLAGRKAHLLILGGSLGAEPLNKLLPQALAQLPEECVPSPEQRWLLLETLQALDELLDGLPRLVRRFFGEGQRRAAKGRCRLPEATYGMGEGLFHAKLIVHRRYFVNIARRRFCCDIPVKL